MAKIIPTGANFFALLWLLLDLDIYVRIMHLRVVTGKPHAQCMLGYGVLRRFSPSFSTTILRLNTFVMKSVIAP